MDSDTIRVVGSKRIRVVGSVLVAGVIASLAIWWRHRPLPQPLAKPNAGAQSERGGELSRGARRLPSALSWIGAKGAGVAVRGVVLHDGETVAGATVDFGNAWTDVANEPLTRVTTDAGGHFDLGYQIRAESWLVVQSGDERRIRRLDLRDARAQEEASSLRITLRSCVASVVGRVVDQHRKPIDGASVMAVAPVVATLRSTDSDGTFKVCADGVSLAFRAAGFGTKTLRPVGIRGNVGDLMLLPETSISGVVLDSKGVGVAGAVVRALGGMDSKRIEVLTTITNQAGEYEVSGAPGGCFSLAARRDREASPSTPMICASAGERVKAEPMTLEKCGIVEGTVRQGSEPLASVAILVDGVRQASTDARGAFEIACVNQGSIAIPGYALVHPAQLSARPGETTRLNLDVVAGSVVRGSVVLEGEPVAEATVVAIPGDRSGARQISAMLEASRASTSADGNFEMRLSPGRYWFVAIDGVNGLRSDEKITEVALKTPPITLELNPGGEIVGVVRDRSGRPLAGVPLVAEPTGDADAVGLTRRRDAVSEGNGEFAFRGLSSGTWTVTMRRPWRSRDGKLAPVVVGRKTSSEIEIRVANLTGLKLKGLVEEDGRGAGFATVFLVGYPRETVADDHGTFTFADLPEGEYRVEALSGDGKLRGRARVAAGDEHVRLVLEPEPDEKKD